MRTGGRSACSQTSACWLREIQRIAKGLRRCQTEMFTIQDLLDVLNEQPANRRVDLIAEGIADLARELGKKGHPGARRYRVAR